MSVYHREKGEFLDSALGSVFNQTAVPDEVVLVEDGPLTDELYAVIERYKSQYDTLKIVPLKQNVGLGEALNKGLAQCSYELVARMDSDDICVSNRFELQVYAFEIHSDAAIIGGWIEEFSTDPSIIESKRILPLSNDELRKFAKSKSPMNHMTVMFKKSEVEAVGGYQPFYLLEDYWLWGRMLKNGAKFYNVAKTLVLARGGTAMTARRGGWKYAKSEIRLQRTFLKMRLINYFDFIKNVSIRFIVRMMPNRLRLFVYQKILR